MKRSVVQKWALASIVSLIVLIFVGAIVRVTGAGLGCPDWPKCWGELIPPTSVEDVDFESLDIERFQKRAEKLGRARETVTIEVLKEEFNAAHTWTEYVNRLFSFPITICSVGLMIVALRSKGLKPRVRKGAVLAFLLVLANAGLGALVVFSRLKTGIITLHMALAFLLLGVLVYVHWAGGERNSILRGASRGAVGLLLGLVLVEGLLGSQIREMTDELQLSHLGEERDLWIGEIESSWVYLIHRSFSWLILAGTLWVFYESERKGLVPWLVMGLVLSLMVMGLVLSQVGIVAVVQVLHVGVAGVLVAVLFHWWLAAERGEGGSVRE